VTLTLKTPTTITKSIELFVQGAGAGGLQDAEGRLIDGNHDRTAGGNAVAVISKGGGVKIDAAHGGPMAVKKGAGRK
jgi:hypothetical protein